MFEMLGSDDKGYALLERLEGDVPGYLSYSTEEGEVVCVFNGMEEAESFYERWRAQIPGGGWLAVTLDKDGFLEVLRNFDLVAVNPNPMPGSQEYLYRRDDFLASLGE